jgi:hypothetical protein
MSREDFKLQLAFDLLEGLKEAWRRVDPEKANAIASGFARGTGGIDVPWLIEQLGPPPSAADALESTQAEIARLTTDCEFLLSVIDSCDEAEAPSCEMEPEDVANIDRIRAALKGNQP